MARCSERKTLDPVGDTLVGIIPTLDLTTGKLAIPFTTGDPNVLVPYGSSRRYFLVATMTKTPKRRVSMVSKPFT